MSKINVRRFLVAMLSGGVLAAVGLGWAQHADAVPGQCVNSPFGGFCDGLPAVPGGTYYHCESALGFSNCYYVRPVPTEVDPRGWTAA